MVKSRKLQKSENLLKKQNKKPSITAFAVHSQLNTDTYIGCIANKSRAQERF